MATTKRRVAPAPVISFTGDPVPLNLNEYVNTSFVQPEAPAAPAPEGRTVLGTMKDVGISALKGVIAVPEAAVGLADLVTGGAAGQALESVGFRPRDAKAMLDEGYSAPQKEAFRRVQAAEGLGDTFMEAISNPSVIGQSVVESLPLMGAGGAVARGAMAVAPKIAPVVAAAGGEGTVMAGSAAEQIRQQTADGRLTAGQAGLAATTGVVGAGFGLLGGKIAQKLGITDVDTLLAGAAKASPAAQKALTRRVLEGAVAEGVLEELPQSVSEQVLQNIALDKPLDEGLDQAAVLGLLSGAVMGGGANALAGREPAPPTEPPPTTPPAVPPVAVNPLDPSKPAGPLTRAANVAAANLAAATTLTGQTGADLLAIPDNPLLAGARVREEDRRQDDLSDQAMARLERLAADDLQAINAARFEGERKPVARTNTAPAAMKTVAPEIDPGDIYPPEPGDILNPKGEPFKNKAAALTASKKFGGQVVQVMEGWAVRGGNKESANVGTTASAATVAAGSGGQLGADTVGGQRDRGRDDAGAGGGTGDAAPAAARSGKPGEPVRTAGLANPALTNEQNAATRPAPQGQAPQAETPAATGGDEARAAAKPAAAGPAEVEGAGVSKKYFKVGGRDPHDRTYERRSDGRLTRSITYPDGQTSTETFATDKNGDEIWVSNDSYEKGVFYPVQMSQEQAAAAIRDDMAGKQTAPTESAGAPNPPAAQVEGGGVGAASSPAPKTGDTITIDGKPAEVVGQTIGGVRVQVEGEDAPRVVPKKAALTASKEDLEHLFGVDQKRKKALDRIAKGTAYFGKESKAREYIKANGLSDTHEAVKSPTGANKWDVVAKKAGLPPTDVRAGEKVVVDGESYTVTGPLKEGGKSVGVVAQRDADTDPLKGRKSVFLRGDEAIQAKLAAADTKAAGAKQTTETRSADARQIGAQARTDGAERVPPVAFTATEKKAWLQGWDSVNVAAPVGEQNQQQPAPAKREPLSNQEQKPETSPLVKAMNDLAEVRQRIADQGRVVDDRLVSRERQLVALVKELQADGQNDENDAEMQAYEAGLTAQTRADDRAKVAAAKPSANTIFTEDAAAAARAILKKKLGTLNTGLDPELMQAGLTLAGYHIEKGARTFAAFAKAMVSDLGDSVRPYLKSWYMGVKYDPRATAFDGMDDAATVEKADVSAIEATSQPQNEVENAGATADTAGKDVPNDPAPEGSTNPLDNPLAAGPAGKPVVARGARSPRRKPGRADAGELRDSGGLFESLDDESGNVGDRRGDAVVPDRPDDALAGNDGTVSAPDYRAPEGSLTRTGSWYDTAARNIDLIEMAIAIEAAGRPATPDEQEKLAKYVGFGAGEIRNKLFPVPHSYAKQQEPDRLIWPNLIQDARWKALAERMDQLPREWQKSVLQSTQYAHYTSEGVIRSIWTGVQRMGFTGGKVLEPGSGIGSFAMLMPDSARKTGKYTGIEFDGPTALIARLLSPQQNMLHADFIKRKLPKDFFDLAIGNPPFSQTKILGDPEYAKKGFMLHDFFFAKSLDRVRPGGLLVFVTSKGTMDKQSDKARKYLSDRADLMGAIRLPQTAFEDNAGTKVVTDIIFLRKRAPGEAPAGPAWNDVKTIQTPDGPAVVNEYFAANPGMVLGQQRLSGNQDDEGRRISGLRGIDEYTVVSYDKTPDELEAKIAKAVESLPENVYSVLNSNSEQVRAETAKVDFDPKVKREGVLYLGEKNQLMRVQSGVGRPLADSVKLSEKDQAWYASYIEVRDLVQEARAAQVADGQWEAALKKLNKAYDAFRKKHGPINDFRVQVRKSTDEDGNEIETEIRVFKNRRLYREDYDAAVVTQLETINEAGEVVKAPFLLGRTIGKPVVREVKSVGDALAVSLDEIGRLDLDDIGRRMKLPRAEVIEALGTQIYETPAGQWQLADEYLSGDVVGKLEEAEEAARVKPSLARNVEALKAVQPEKLGPSQISVKLGASWVPPAYVTEFAQEIGAGEVRFDTKTESWQVEGGNLRSQRTAGAEYGTADRSPSELLEAALNSRTVTIKKRTEDKKEVTDADATAAAAEAIKKIREKFKSWIWTDSERASELVEIYNTRFNNIAPRRFDGSHLTLPGVSLRFKLHPHQLRAIWRQIQTGDTYLAHAVGAGKTIEMIAGGMEQKRLGLIKKPMYVVPNHMLEQFANEFMELYPLANIMVADDENFSAERRRAFVAAATLNAPDAIVITHSAFERIGVKEETVAPIRDEILLDLETELDDADKGDRVRRSQLEQQIEAVTQRFDRIVSAGGKDSTIKFEDIGADYVYVDEAHVYRKLDFSTNQKLKGIDPNGSKRALDMYVKTRYLEKQRPGRAMTFASGTPVTNTMGELYTIMRFFAPDELDRAGISTFDGWARQFGESVAALEANAAGRYEVVERFAKFDNVPELMSRIRQFMDVLTSESLGSLVKRPDVEGGKPNLVMVEGTPQLKSYMKTVLLPRLEASRKWKPSKDEPFNPDPVIAITSDGRFAALDPRFFGAAVDENTPTKLNAMADAIAAEYKATAENVYRDKAGNDEPVPGSTQIVFYNLGFGAQSQKNRGFDARGALNKKLIAGGVKREHIAWFDDADSDAKKEAIFKGMRAGQIRVLIGSAKKMGTGVNVQKRLSMLHYFDPPWFPSDVEQPHGRIIRQGNQNETVRINWYATKGTYDSTMWQMVARKQRFIDQAFTGDKSMRSMDDMSEASQYEQAAAMASGDPRAMQLAGLRQDVERMERLQSAHASEQIAVRSELRSTEWRIENAEKRIKTYSDAFKALGEKYVSFTTARVGKATFNKMGDFGQALKDAFNKGAADHALEPTQEAIPLGSIEGLPVAMYQDFDRDNKPTGNFELVVDVGGYKVQIASGPGMDERVDAVGLARRVVNGINEIDRDLRTAKSDLVDYQTNLKRLSKKMGAPFEYQQELAEKYGELKRLEAELKAEGEADAKAAANAVVINEDGSTGAPAFMRAPQTETKAFKDWFGDSVVTESGKAGGVPLMVYHGTTADFAEFRPSKNSAFGTGIYFTDSPETAESYATLTGEPGAKVMPVYLQITQPLRLKEREIKGDMASDRWKKRIRDGGYDGLIVERDEGDFTYVAFRPEQIKSATGNNGNFDPKDPDIRFLRGDPAPRGSKVVAVQQFMDSITEKWSNAPTVIVAANMEDTLVPKAVRDYNASQMAKDAAGAPMGFFYGGKVYVLADSLNSPQDALTVLAHEALGHYGLRGMFGDRLDGIKSQIIAMRKKEVLAKVKAYGLDPAKREDLMYAAEEVLAEMAQTVPSLGFVKRAVAIVRQWLRENIPGFDKMKLTDDEIINQYIVPARGWVVRGRESGVAEPALAFMRDGKPVLWRSSLRDGLAEVKMQGGRADGWKAAIQGLINKGAVKEDEVEWSGIREWLDLQTGKVSKDAVLAYLDANGVQVQEVVMGSGLTMDQVREKYMQAMVRAGEKASVADQLFREMQGFAENGEYDDAMKDRGFDLVMKDGSLTGNEIHDAASNYDGGDTKYSQYTLPGGQNYREVLLTLPPSARRLSADEKLARVNEFKAAMRDKYGNGWLSKATADELATNERLSMDMAADAVQANDYKSSHWDTPNVIAHIRLNDRTDADGKRVLFVEEIQSDWGQEGKKKGFNTKVTPEQVAREVYGRDLAELDAAEREGVMIETEGRNEGTGGAAGTQSGVVPRGPFVTSTDKWLTLALKRVITMAAQEGYDRVAFVNGEQSAERYDLSKQVASIRWDAESGDKVRLEVTSFQRTEPMLNEVMSLSKVEDTIGKELAAKIQQSISNGVYSGGFSGNGLKVGGEGMRAFYDKIVPTSANKLLAKLGGGKVEVVELQIPGQREGETDRASGAVIGPNGTAGQNLDATGFTITPAMREKAGQGLPMFSRGTAGNVLNTNTLRTQATERVSDFFADMKAPGKLNWWHKTIGTQYNLAQRYPRFKRVFDAAQNFLNDVSLYATEAADLAPKILPKLETWRDIAKSPISAEDNKAIAAPIFEGTLKWTRADGELVEADDVATAGVVWTDAELKARYNLTPQQISLYREFRAAVDKSLTNLAVSDMVRFAGRDAAPIRSAVMGAANLEDAERVLVDYLQSVADSDPDRADVLESTIAAVQKKAERAGDLMRRGYAPLSRFGQYTLDVIDNGERVYFGMFESAAEAAKMARRMRANFPGAEIARGTVSQEEYKLFAGVSPETVELFGDLLGLEAQGDSAADKAFQTYIKVAKANRSSMKRLITRKGMAGFSEDAGRVLAGFVYSNARQTSQNLHMGELTEAAMAVNEGDARGDGELKDRAAKLVEYVKNPVEEAQAFRSLLFVQYLGGSVASALVNMTQPIQVTLPYLSQYGGPAKAAGQMRKALTDVWKNTTGDARLDAALKRAEEEGLVAPQEVHQLMAQAQGKGSLQSGDGTVLGDASAKASNALSKLALGWGKFFGAAEQFNRRVTFIAAYRTAVDQGIARPAEFAEKALAETQFLYNKGNKPQWARGAVGSTLFTFKQYSISYVELMNRMWQSGPEGKKAVLLAMGLLFLVGGAGGLPFVEDAEDLLDAMMQRLGYNYSTKLARRQFFERVVGKEAARFMERGISGLPGAPLDVSGRLGMGNLIPGTGLLVQKQDSTRDVTELAGPAGDFIGRLFKGANQALQGEVGQAAVTVSPAAARNAAKAVDMYATGIYKDERGRKVLDVDAYDAAIKFIGFQPNDVARVQQASQTAQKLISQVKVAEAAIADRWAKALAEGDADGVKAAREELRDWNRKNPETPIRIAPGQINKRVKAMRQDKATRLEKTAPREIRNTVREELRPA